MTSLSITQQLGLAILSEGVDPDVDLVFVYGRSSELKSVWAFGEGFWVKDSLSQRFPNFRIMAYGYGVSWGRSKVSSNWKAYAYELLWYLEDDRRKKKMSIARPVIILGHGKGGLVAQETILLLKAERRTISAGGSILFGIKPKEMGISNGDVLGLSEYPPDNNHLKPHNSARRIGPSYIEIAATIDKMGKIVLRDQYLAAERSITRLDESDYDTLSSLNKRASQDLFQAVEAVQIQMISVCARDLGEDHPNTLASMSDLASTYSKQGLWGEAEELETKVLEARVKILGDSHHDTLTSMTNRARIYVDQGRLDEAEELERRGLKINGRNLGEDHPDTIISIANLACICINQERWEEAEKLKRRVLAVRGRFLDTYNRHTLASMANLASTYTIQGLWKEAGELQAQLSKIMTKSLGQPHPDTLKSMANLASIYLKQGQWDTAEKLESCILQARIKVLGYDHCDTLTSMANLACIYVDQKLWKKAERLQIQVLRTMERVLGEDFPETLNSRGNLASTYSCQGRWDEAEKLEKRGLETSKRVLGEGRHDTLQLVKYLDLVLTCLSGPIYLCVSQGLLEAWKFLKRYFKAKIIREANDLEARISKLVKSLPGEDLLWDAGAFTATDLDLFSEPTKATRLTLAHQDK